jgi:hypothetical protein
VDLQLELRLALGREPQTLEHAIERTGAERPMDHEPHGARAVVVHHVHHGFAKVRVVEIGRRDQQPTRERSFGGLPIRSQGAVAGHARIH